MRSLIVTVVSMLEFKRRARALNRTLGGGGGGLCWLAILCVELLANRQPTQDLDLTAVTKTAGRRKSSARRHV